MKKTSEIYLADDYLKDFIKSVPRYNEIVALKKSIAPILDRPFNDKFRDAINSLPEFKTKHTNFFSDAVCIGDKSELTGTEYKNLYDSLKVFMPWRKGPFNYFGFFIESEWRSEFKWNRIAPYLDLKGKKVADIGCNNTYYMYRILSHNPKLVVGFDPIERYYFNYLLNQRFVQASNVKFELIGVENVLLYEGFFDVVLAMGVLYHRRNPMQMLEDINKSMKNGGTLILETAGIPGDESYCLFPEDRYLKAGGYWFLPTWKAAVSMLKRSNFCDIESFTVANLGVNEQRRTPWVGTESLEDFLDKNDPTKTVEGYPAPVRIYIKAKKNFDKQLHKK